MPAHSKGPRLWLRPARRGPGGGITHPATWHIRDAGGYCRSTCCGKDDIRSAERELERYIAAKRVETSGKRAADAIPIADILALYATEIAAHRARPRAAIARLGCLERIIGDRSLADINGALCRQYAARRGSQTAARRELEDLRAAIGHYRREGLCNEIPAITLPPRPPSRERWLTRDEAARLIWAAWRFREAHGKDIRASRQHIARFILVALYTGTRSGAVCSAAFGRSPSFGRIDTERGVFHRRPESRAETKKRQPPVPLPPRLLAHMRRWERRGDLAPVTWNGRPVERMKRAFANVAAGAGLPDVTPHTLRHTAATWLMQAGVDMWSAAGYLGMSVVTLTRVYGHHHPDHLRAARDAIGRRAVARSVAENSKR